MIFLKKDIIMGGQKNKRGFTIIELIISIFILSIAVVGIFGAFTMISILTAESTDRLSSVYLAQEGIEIIRNIRDNNWLSMDATGTGNWDDNLNSCETLGCEVDYKSTAPTPFSLGGNHLYINTDGFYGYSPMGTGTKTKFVRKISIACLPNNDCANDYILKVSVQVSWDKKATIIDNTNYAAETCTPGVNCLVAQGSLYNWYK